MLDIRFVRENPEIVKENIKKKFQDAKLPLVDEAVVVGGAFGGQIAFKRGPVREVLQTLDQLTAKDVAAAHISLVGGPLPAFSIRLSTPGPGAEFR